jgi:hypothetical protein
MSGTATNGKDQNCGNCIYFREMEKGTGHCHRYPPQFAGEQTPRELHRWKHPLVGGHAWCGEHWPMALKV